MIFDVYLKGRVEPVRVWADRFIDDGVGLAFLEGSVTSPAVRARFPAGNVDGFTQHDDTHDDAVSALYRLLTEVLGVDVGHSETARNTPLRRAIVLEAEAVVARQRGVKRG